MEQEKDFNEAESTQPKTEYQQNSANDNQEYGTSEAGDRRPYRPRFTRSYGERGGYRSSYPSARIVRNTRSATMATARAIASKKAANSLQKATSRVSDLVRAISPATMAKAISRVSDLAAPTAVAPPTAATTHTAPSDRKAATSPADGSATVSRAGLISHIVPTASAPRTTIPAQNITPRRCCDTRKKMLIPMNPSVSTAS